MRIRTFEESDRESVIKLWQECNLVFPQNDPHKDIDRKMNVGPDLFLVGLVGSEIAASVMGGYDGHRGWAYYMAVKEKYRAQGFGKEIMNELEKRLLDMGCPKINLQVRQSNTQVIKFYESMGFLTDEVAGLGKRLIPD